MFLDNLIDEDSNLLSKIMLSYRVIERLAVNYELNFISSRRQDVEWKIKFPNFIDQFYDFILTKRILPTQEEFWSYYLNNNQKTLADKDLSDAQYTALQARIYRTYPSLVRDLHLGLMLRDEQVFDQTIYNKILDLKYDTDLVVVENGVSFSVKLFIDTKRANEARHKKKNRHSNLQELTPINCVLTKELKKDVGDFYLYSFKAVRKIRSIIYRSLYELEANLQRRIS